MKAGQCYVVLIGGWSQHVELLRGKGCTIDYSVVVGLQMHQITDHL